MGCIAQQAALDSYYLAAANKGVLCNKAMNKYLLIKLMLLMSPFLQAESENSFYQITYTTAQNDSYLFICVNDECQRTSSNKQAEDSHIYDFGIFPIPVGENIDLKVWRFNEGENRIRRAPEYIPDECTINKCGSFKFIKANGPVTSTTDKCKIGLGICHKRRHYENT